MELRDNPVIKFFQFVIGEHGDIEGGFGGGSHQLSPYFGLVMATESVISMRCKDFDCGWEFLVNNIRYGWLFTKLVYHAQHEHTVSFTRKAGRLRSTDNISLICSCGVEITYLTDREFNLSARAPEPVLPAVALEDLPRRITES